MTVPHVLRVARPTDQLDRVAAMYMEGLGFSVLSRFDDHNGFDGVILGRPADAYHLEFTTQRGRTVGYAPTNDHLLVFYVADRSEWAATCVRLARAGFRNVKSENPYWDRDGRTFEDVDGYRVVLQNLPWSA
jgi:hypothetical protein